MDPTPPIARSTNITANDKERLFQIVIKNVSVVESKKTDAVSVLEKNKCWESIANEFNASSNYKRTAKQLRTCYQNAKSALKKDLASDKVEVYKTGGGSFKKKTDENHPLMNIVLKETTPLNNQFDSSNDYFDEHLSDSFMEDENLELTPSLNARGSTTPPTLQSIEIQTIDINMEEYGQPSTSQRQQSCAPASSRPKKRTHKEFVQTMLTEFSDLKKAKYKTAAEKNSARTDYYKIKTEALKKNLTQNENTEN